MKEDIWFGSVSLDLIKYRQMHCMELLYSGLCSPIKESVVLTEYGWFSQTLYKNVTVNLHMITVWGPVLCLSFCFSHIFVPISVTDSLYPVRQQSEEQ